MQQFCIKTKVISGSGAMDGIGKLGIKKSFIFCDPFINSSGLVSRLTDVLEQNGTQYEIYTDIVADPSLKAIEAGLQKMIPFEPDSVIALGGGSTMDTAKAAAFFYPDVTGKAKPKCVAIPTTSGTGSECTSFSIVTNPDTNTKDALIDDRLLPDYAVLDAEYVRGLPPQATADTGLDALTHAIESYVSINAQEFTDALCEKAVRLIFRYLPRACADPDDMAARENMHYASCIAGMAFNRTGLGITHGMAHAMGASFHLTHGRSCALFLPAVIEYNAQVTFDKSRTTEAARKYAELANILWGFPASISQGVGSLVRGVRRLSAQVGVSGGIGDLDISRQDFTQHLESMSEAAVQDRSAVTNPRPVSAEDIRKIYLSCY